MTAFKIACHNKHRDVINYLILERDFKIDNDTFDFLNTEQSKNDYIKEVLELIEKRDFTNKLNNSLSIKSKGINKIKI